jgi:methionyl-tRNA synthetase
MSNNKDYKRYTVTAALPYANGPLHIGHLAGCYLPADIYVRYLRNKGEDVAFICGSDEHGVAITLKARKEGITPKELVDKYHAIIEKSFSDFGISFDIYSRTTDPLHYKTAQDFFLVLLENNALSKHVSQQFFDSEANIFLADRYIQGTCPNCSFDKAYGDQCENCGKSLDPKDLINPKSTISGSEPTLRDTEHYYLKLNDYQDFLTEWLNGDKTSSWKSNVLGQSRSWLNQGLQERSVTRDLDWGVPVPLENAKGKVMYVWLDAPIGYISNTIQWAKENNKNWEDYWKKEDTKLVQFIGKDNIVFHCIIFPTMLKAHGDYILPTNVPANEFLNIEGNKVSTSRNWAVWLHEYLIDFPESQDVLRYVLTSIAPETKDSDFTWADFQSKNNNELVAILGNFANRLFVLTEKNFNAQIPSANELSNNELELKKIVAEYPSKINNLIENFKFREAQSELMNLARVGNKYLTDNEPWKTIKTNIEEAKTCLFFGFQILAELTLLMEPFLPHTSQKLKKSLNIKQNIAKGELNLLSENTPIVNPGLLFTKIEDSTITEQIEKLNKSLAVSTQEQSSYQPLKSEIQYDDFAKIDLRAGIITAAQKVPKADKLLQLSIDLGFEKRTILSGIAENFEPENIIGKKVVVVANLAPRKMRGIMSEGMILMAENKEGKLEFVQWDGENLEGGIVS